MSRSSSLGCLTPWHKPTQLKTCLSDKPKRGCRLGCPVPSSGGAAKSPWVQEKQGCPTEVSNPWEQLARLTLSSTAAPRGASATSHEAPCGESPKNKGWRRHQLPASHTPQHTPYTHRSLLSRSASPWISQAVCWKAATASPLVTWFPSKQTGVRSSCPCHCPGAGKRSAPPCGTEGRVFRDRGLFSFLAAFENCLWRCEDNRYPGAAADAFPAGAGEGESGSRASVAQKPAPGCWGGLPPGPSSEPWQARQGSLTSP